MRTQDSIPTPTDEKGFYCNYKVHRRVTWMYQRKPDSAYAIAC